MRSRNLFNFYSLRILLTKSSFCCFIYVKETTFGVFTFFLLVSSRYLFMRVASPKNHPSSFPVLLTPLYFILFAEGGVSAIAQIREIYAKKVLERSRIVITVVIIGYFSVKLQLNALGFIAETTWSKLVIFNIKRESNLNHKADIVSQIRKVQIHM